MDTRCHGNTTRRNATALSEYLWREERCWFVQLMLHQMRQTCRLGREKKRRDRHPHQCLSPLAASQVALPVLTSRNAIARIQRNSTPRGSWRPLALACLLYSQGPGPMVFFVRRFSLPPPLRRQSCLCSDAAKPAIWRMQQTLFGHENPRTRAFLLSIVLRSLFRPPSASPPRPRRHTSAALKRNDACASPIA